MASMTLDGRSLSFLEEFLRVGQMRAKNFTNSLRPNASLLETGAIAAMAEVYELYGLPMALLTARDMFDGAFSILHAL
jgi:hypothetical protein